MRLIRPTNNKENIEPCFTTTRNQVEELKLQLKAAYSQITSLKQTNKKLMMKIQMNFKDSQNYLLIQQQLDFRRQQQANTKEQISNYEEINSKLRQQLDKKDKQNQELYQELTQLKTNTTFQSNLFNRQSQSKDKRSNGNSVVKTKYNQLRSATCSYQNSMRTSSVTNNSVDRAKQNHCMTPKSKIRLNMQALIPQPFNQRKRVFM